MLKPVGRAGTLTEAIASQLIQLIMSGTYNPGERLPSEFELAEQFQAGRGAVREALKALSVVGLVRVSRGKGTFVNKRENFLTGPLLLGVKADAGLRSLIEARTLIEVELAGLAAERIAPGQVQPLDGCLLRMRDSLNPADSKYFMEADLDFHFATAAAADNFILSQFLTLLHNLMRQWITEALLLPGVAAEAFEQHKAIFSAIKAHKPRAARLAMERHLVAMGKRFLLAEESKLELNSEEIRA